MRILVINPNTSEHMTEAIGVSARKAASPGTITEAVSAVRGPRSIEGHLDHYLGATGVLERIAETRGGFDGYVIACFGDPALDAAREMLDVPVAGIAESSMLMACMLGWKFSVLTILDRARPATEELIRKYGLWERCASVRATGLAVLEIEKDPAAAVSRLEAAGKLAVEEDGAEVLLLGCAGMTGFADKLHAKLHVPVLDGVACAVRMVEAMAGCGLRPSKRAYYKEPEMKEVIGYGERFNEFYHGQG